MNPNKVDMESRRYDSRAVAPPDVLEPVNNQPKHLRVGCPPLDVTLGVAQTVRIASCKIQRGVGSAANLAIRRKWQENHALLRRKERVHVPMKRHDMCSVISKTTRCAANAKG